MIIMKKLTSLLIGCSLALAGAALAQQPVEEQSPSSKGKRAPEKAHAAQAQPGAPQRAHAPQAQGGPARDTGAVKQRGATNERAATTNQPGRMNERGAMNQPGVEKGRKTHVGREPGNAHETNVSGQSAGGTTNERGVGKNEKGRAHGESANAPTSNAKEQAEQERKQQAEKQRTEQAEQQRKGVNEPAATAKTSANPAAAETNKVQPSSAAGQQNAQANAGVKAKKPEPQQVQQVKSQHANFHAQPKPQQVQAVTFNQNHRIEGSDRWQGPQYQVFRSYHPEWHDQGWYRSHYSRVELIGGGYYYFNNGYWYPAWGYSPSEQYYAYDGPIYVGHHAEPPDKVIADTQALLQQMGYYKGEVDGLLGPLTREALTAYQTDNGLTVTAAIDEPTLDSLGLS
jgi:hypothetical protein